jgi:hypothetical protein
MATNEIARQGASSSAPVAKDAPTEQQASQAGTPKRFARGQTVCNEKNDKGKLCNGHLKQVSPIREEARQHMRGDDLLYRCQTCGTLYMGPPLGHVRDPRKQARYVQSELVAILEAAGGTLPAFKKTETGAWVPIGDATASHAAPAASPAKPAAAKPAPAAAPASTTPAAGAGGESPEEKRARIIAEAKAKAAARMAGGTPAASAPSSAPSTATSTTPSTASPTEATRDASPDETSEQKRARIMAEVKAKAAARMAGKGGGASTAPQPATGDEITPAAAQPPTAAPAPPATAAAPPVAATTATARVDVPSDETPEQKRARMMAEIKAKAAAKMAAKNSSSGAKAGGETSIDMPPTTAQPPSPTSGTDSSAAADAHRPAAEAQAATGQASAAPLSPAAATASPAAGAETPADLAPDASTELTPGAPIDERATDESTPG